MSSAEAAEFAKLADTTYRDVNIALANEFARYADRIGVDITEVIAAANSQPYSHIHQPGLGVGGHCIPVYPHFLLDRAPELELVALARRVNDGQVDVVLDALSRDARRARGRDGPGPRPDLSRRASRSSPIRARCRSSTGLRERGAQALAYDPLLTDEEIERTGARAVDVGRGRTGRRGDRHPDRRSGMARRSTRPGSRASRSFVDGRNSLRDLVLPEGVDYRGIGGRR